MKPSVLIVAPYLPFPTRSNGLSVRLSPVVSQLARERDVHLVVLGDASSHSREGLAEAEGIFSTIRFVSLPSSRLDTRVGLGHALLRRPSPPHQLLFSRTAHVLKAMGSIQRRAGASTVLVLGDLLSHAGLLSKNQFPRHRHVIDWVDSPSLHLHRVGESSGQVARDVVEAIATWETAVNERLDQAIYISKEDAEFSHGFVSEKVAVVPNGLVDDFPEERNANWRQAFSRLPVITVGFIGNMAYEPNDLAAQALCSEYLPVFRRKLSAFAFRTKIVGRSPTPELLRCRSDVVEVTGAVDEIWTHLEDIDVFVFPMKTGAGMQNKILEAMRSKRPVVASRLCRAGLPHSTRFAVEQGDTPDEVADAIGKLVASPMSVRNDIDTNLDYLATLRTADVVRHYLHAVLSDGA